MCPFCLGAAAWTVAGVVSAGGIGVLAAIVGVRHSDGAPVDDGARAEAGRSQAGSE